MSESDGLEEIDCEHVLTGSGATVLMAKGVCDEFFELEQRKKLRLLANAKLWADGQRLSPEQFQGNEGRCGGENDRMLIAVKTHKVRLYGFIRRFRGKKCLLIVEIDSAKKQDRPNPRIVKKAREAVVQLDGLCGENDER